MPHAANVAFVHPPLGDRAASISSAAQAPRWKREAEEEWDKERWG
jgi:hypothetical protein